MADRRRSRIRRIIDPLRVEPGKRVKLSRDFDPGYTGSWVRKSDAKGALAQGVEMLSELQTKLAAQDTYGVLVIFQAMDAAGKDGTIRHVMSGVNPQGVRVHSFKQPSAEELDHDYLWRAAQRVPARGEVGTFNRSYYEEVLVVRVHDDLLDRQKLPKRARRGDIWKRRYGEINDWERYLVEQGFPVVKLFLHLSRDEQRERFLARIDEPEKHWKFSAGDARERRFWDDYQRAFEQMLTHTSTDWAPWYVIPADHKWFMRIASASAIIDALMTIDPQWPTVADDDLAEMAEARKELLAGH